MIFEIELVKQITANINYIFQLGVKHNKNEELAWQEVTKFEQMFSGVGISP